ncbi:MAG TPA: Gfo/Idh/MocA family oxidoreductase [Pirellulaceae bacterium]|nr:Gfo/Idh/MocA family oxidoreductase [Pirellulaceae bacterium]
MNDSRRPNRPRRGLLIGAGYFSDFHLDGWSRLSGAEIVCVCDLDEEKARSIATKYHVADICTGVERALEREDLDFIDIATPPAGRLDLMSQALRRGVPVICQKPLAEDFETAQQIIALADAARVPVMIHDNFRFQPWHREIKRLLNEGVIGHHLHTITMRTRTGDGWGADAYLSRQPYFRSMPRMLVHETGIHFVDTFRFLAGEIVECWADLRRLNDAICGEDTGVMVMRHAGGARTIWDANRYNESLADDPRYTFGELLVEADRGSLWLGLNGEITVKALGLAAYRHEYSPSKLGFAGNCVQACQQHFLDVLDGKSACETSPSEYLKSLRVVEAIYQSNQTQRSILLASDSAIANRTLAIPAADNQGASALVAECA